MTSKVKLEDRDDLSIAYTPGVAQPCKEIFKDKRNVYRYTAKSNLVGVVSDGTAVLGLGDIGAEAAIPVMEGKAVLFKQFGGGGCVSRMSGHQGHGGDHHSGEADRAGVWRD